VDNRDELEHQLREVALSSGADFFGVADLSAVADAVREQGGEMMVVFPRAVSIGLIMPSAIVDQLPHRADKAVAQAYRSHSYHILNRRLDDIASRLSGVLQRGGYRAFPIPASQTVDEERMAGLFSHKMAAHLAGLGWIGKSCLLVTPQAGPRARWASVLTDAPLAAGQPLAERCGECDACVEACPPRAFSGRNFRPDEPREIRFDVVRCEEYHWREGGEEGVCGMCVYICPHGRGK